MKLVKMKIGKMEIVAEETAAKINRYTPFKKVENLAKEVKTIGGYFLVLKYLFYH